MATPEEKRPTTLDEAVIQLNRDPSSPVRARVGDLDVELRVVSGANKKSDSGPYSSLLSSAGSAEAFSPDVSRNKHAHLGDIYASKRTGR